MKQTTAASVGLGLCVLACSAFASDVIINELMYHPFHTTAQAENIGKEWIELHNRGTNTVDLTGWRLTKGVDFTFTNGTLAPGAYLVVAASRTNFLATYPTVSNVVGDWIGHLGNTDDEITLLNAIGEEQNKVAYADSGDWSVRARESVDGYGLRGWGWLAPHDGGGMTLELINPSMPNKYGQNWSASSVNNGTPGQANSVFATNTAPFIQNVSHFPLVPRSTETVLVKAEVLDELAEGVTVGLSYRVATNATPPAFTTLAMYDDGMHGDGRAGDGIYAATVPAFPTNTVVEFYVAATDSEGRTRTWPAPSRNAPDLGGGVLPPESGANANYIVDDRAYTGTQPFYRLIMIESERAFMAGISNTLRNSDAAANGTFLTIDPNGTEVHHLTSYRRRGAGSRQAALPNYRVNLASDHRWHGVTALNLNSQYTHSQVAGSVLAAMAGLNVEYQKAVQVRVNDRNLASTGSPQFGSYSQQEVPDGDYAKNHYPSDPDGNLYRASDGTHRDTLAYLGTNPVSYINIGYSKTSNGAEYDWLDIIDLADILSNAADSDYVQRVRARMNVEEWMLYFAVFTLLDSKETSLATGQGDDYELYRGLIDTRFQVLGHDFDTILNQGDAAGNTNDSIFRMTNVVTMQRLMRRPEFAPIYYRTLTNLLLTTFSPSRLDPTLDMHLGSWVAGGVIANMKSFAVGRNAGVMAQIPLNISISHGLTTNVYPYTTTSSVTLFGSANAITTRSVLVNGANAVWSAFGARWTNTVTLLPGINRILVQARDEYAQEFERSYIDIWYDTGSSTSIPGPIESDLTLTAAGSPYTFSGTVAVQNDAILTIEAGTTLYMAPGAVLNLNGTGTINAQGTDTRRIRIGRNPGVSGNWGSIDFTAATYGSVLAYVDFDSVGGTTLDSHNAQIHVNNSLVTFDHCTWANAPAVQYISFDNSSFLVQNCTFPTYPGPTGPEMLHGVNGIPSGGYGIFRDNYFGHTWGFNDTIDFTGGNRPGAILQVIGNVFDGATDDHLDLDSTDAWIEGNTFLHAHRDPTRTDDARDTASAISGGVDMANQYSEWTIINNLFYDVDHACLAKGGGRFTFVNNTLVHVNKESGAGLTNDISAFDWTDDGVALPASAVGAGAYVANNIIWDCPMLTANYNSNNHTLIFENNILPSAWTGPGSNNIVADPRLNLGAITSPLTADWKTVKVGLTPLSGSPAMEAGWGAKYDRGGLNPKGILVFGEPRGTTSVNRATLTVAPGGTFNWGTNAYLWGYTHYKWKLDSGAWSAEIPISTQRSITLSNLSNGPHTAYFIGKNDAGYYQDNTLVYTATSSVPAHATASRTWTVNTNLSRILISEVLAKNVAAALVNGSYPDAIELYNAGAADVDLGGMSLTDDPQQPRKFTFRAGTVIPAGGYRVVYAASGEAAGQIYTGFALNDQGDAVCLFDKDSNGGGLLDSVVFGLQLRDLSIGRLGDGTWSLTKPTLGSPNIVQPLGDPMLLRINEWLAAAGAVFQTDFIELYNTDSLPVALGNLALSDCPMSLPRRSVIPPLSFIAANGWQSFLADGNTNAGMGHVNFHLSADGGWISLADTNGILIDCVVYSTQVPDISMGRSPDGTITFASFNQATPGGGNPGQTVIVTSVTTNIVPLTQVWRMEASGVNLGTTWRSNSYDDSSWFGGNALFYNYDGSGTQPSPIPANSVVPFTSPKQTTVYFRTTFNYSGPAVVNVLFSHVIDDGCVLYLNNQEVYRYNIGAGVVVTYSTTASPGMSGAPPLLTDIPVTLSNLIQGTNYLAIEVHQQSTTSSDIAMALAIDSQKLVTNYLSIPLVLSEVFTKNQSWTNAAGKTVDWVELYNPSAAAVDISDLSLTDDPTRPRRWTFPEGATIPSAGYYVVEFDDSEPYTPWNAGFELSADSGAVYLFHRPAAGGALLDSIVYGVQAADLSLGRATAGQNTTWTLCQPTRGSANVTVALGNPSALKVNEWMPNAANGGDDWFEIYNPGAQPVALGGLHLTDDLSSPTKHTIRALSFIGSGRDAWLQFIADNDTTKGADHVGFALNNTAESIGIYTSNTVPTQINSITYSNVQNGVSQGRLPDGGTNIVSFTNSISPEAPNWLPLNAVVINEALTRPTPPTEQAIEIHNASEVDAAIGGWYLSNAQKDQKRFQIAAGTIVPAGGFKVFYANRFNASNGVPPSFALNGTKSDELYLCAADANGNLTGYRASVDFGAADAGVSFGRHEKSTGDDFVAMSARTFGVNNPATVEEFRSGTGATNAYPLVGPLVINEIHYHPPNIGTNDNAVDEFVEIFNLSGTDVPLYDPANTTNAWRLRNAVDFDFPTNATIPAGGFAVVVSFDPSTNAAALASFRSKYGMSPTIPVFGPWSGKLDNSSEAVELQRPDAPVQQPDSEAGRVPYILSDRVKYSDTAPWPSAADGNTNGVGLSLQRRVSFRYGNDSTNWVAAVPTPGSANGAAANTPPVITAAPTNVATGPGSNVTFTVAAAGAGTLSYEWRYNGIVIAGATNASFTVTNAQASKAGRYSVLVANPWGVAVGGPALLSVQAPPQIVQQPQDYTVVTGSDAVFVVTASGGSLTYRWRFNGTNLSGANNASLMLNSVTTNNAGPYTVIVSNSLGSVTSTVATLTVLVPPAITAQPQSVDVIIGSNATFSVTASGTLPLAFQWRFNGTSLSGATNAVLAISGAQLSDAGQYSVVITNSAGVTSSVIATLTVIVPPTITVTASDPIAAEPANTGTFTFARSGSTTGALSIRYSVSGSATAGSDYGTLAGVLMIPDGSASADVVVTPVDDGLMEGDETVIVTIIPGTNALPYFIGSPSNATVVIFDNDNQPPVITITSPVQDQLFISTPTNVLITVNAADSDGSVTKVEYFIDQTNKLGESTVAPFSFTWSNAPAGSNTLIARATDNLGSTAVSGPVGIVLNALPSVAIVSPVTGATFVQGGDIPIIAYAVDDGSVTQVVFYANGLGVGVATAAPYTALITNAGGGTFLIWAVARDDFGMAATSAVVSVAVNQPGIFDDFEPDIDLAQWSAFGTAAGVDVLANNYAGSVSGTHSLWFGSDSTRFATTRPVDTSRGGNIRFQLRISNGSLGGMWESADLPGEGVVFEYSTNSGSNWVTIGTFDTAGAIYTQGWTLEQYAIPVGAQNTNTLFRWRQLSNSGSCCDHWALDDVQILVGPTPPIITTQPVNKYAVAGSTVAFSVSVFGTSPFWYQWRWNGSNVANATNASLTMVNIGTNQAGLYSVFVTNLYGSTISSNALLTVVEGNSEYFRITALTTDNVSVQEHYNITAYDNTNYTYGRGGIAVSSDQLVVNAGAYAARFASATLTGGAALNRYYDGLATDLRMEKMYAFGTNATGPAVASRNSTTLTHLIELGSSTGLPTGNAIPLCPPITLRGNYGSYGFFSGYGRLAVANGSRVYCVSLPSGAVADLGQAVFGARQYSPGWGYWGLLESTENGLSVLYPSGYTTMTRVPLDGTAFSTAFTFVNLGYYTSLSFSVSRARWYFDHMSSSQFASGGTEVVGFADAQFTLESPSALPPTVLVPPQSVQALLGGAASFGVTAVGALPLAYQWCFNGTNLSGQTGASLTLSNIQLGKVGSYAVVISNAFGVLTTPPVALSIAAPPLITAQPFSATVRAGTNVLFTISHTGDGPFLYQWRFNDNDISGATNTSYTIPVADYYDSGNYSIEVRNAVGVVVSANARLTVLSPPFFTFAPESQRDVLRGMNFTLIASVDGNQPCSLQWNRDGSPLSGMTNSTLVVTNSQSSATYALVVTNMYGAVTTTVAVTVLELNADSFAIQDLYTNGTFFVNVYNWLDHAYYGNGVASTVNRVLLNGDGVSGVYSAGDLTTVSNVSAPRAGLVSDLRSRAAYSLGTGSTMLDYYGSSASSLIRLDDLSRPTGTIITLSTNLYLGYGYAVFSGYGRIVVMNGDNDVYNIALPSGQVTSLGSMQSYSYYSRGGYGYRGWGVAETIGTNTWLVNLADSQTAIRWHVPDGQPEALSLFANLGSYVGNFTVCPPRNRWYFNSAYESQFGTSGSSYNNLFSAKAAFLCLVTTNIPASIIEQPVSRIASAGSTVLFTVLADGTGPLAYQWRFQGNTLSNETNASLTLTNARSWAEGSYVVVVSNALNVVTSSVVTLVVDYGASSTNTVGIFGLTNTIWRYNQTAVFNNSTWAASNYNDSAWPAGRALLAVEDRATITPLTNTWLLLGRTSYYFRVFFNITSNFPSGTLLRATTMIDDGAVIFINGRELQRVRMNSGYNYAALANAQPPGGDAVLEYFYWSATNLIVGSNLFAAEVHQQAITSSDIVWGMAIDALIPALNRPPVITNQPLSRTVSNGVPVSFTVGASGTAPLSYQWIKDGTNLSGATSSALNLASPQRRDGGVYVARVTNPYDSVLSSNAILTILMPPIQFIGGGFTFSAPGQFMLKFSGDTNGVFAVEASTNLVSWVPAGTVTNVTGSVLYSDPGAATNEYRFYRLRLIP